MGKMSLSENLYATKEARILSKFENGKFFSIINIDFVFQFFEMNDDKLKESIDKEDWNKESVSQRCRTGVNNMAFIGMPCNDDAQ